jgi:azurin
MIKPRALLFSTLAVLFVAGCGKSDSTVSAAAPAAAAKPAGPRTIEITAGDNNTMVFSVTSIEAKAGEELKVVFSNNGTAPKEVMGHNWVLLKKGSDLAAFATAAMVAKDTDYIPPALKDQVIAHSEVLGPRKSAEVTFKAPTEPGEYPYLCSFPAHFQIGMKGVLIVK